MAQLTRITAAFRTIAFLCVATTSAIAAPLCPPAPPPVIPVRSALASAGFFANLRGASNSINVQMNQLLGEARARAGDLTKGSPPCIPGCTAPVAAVLFQSAPNLTLSDYDEFAACQTHYEATQATPIAYAHRLFSSEDDAREWYKDLTQGDGPDGEDLYLRCPGRCSPIYSSVIYKYREHYVVTTHVVCGHARDKSDDQYRLTAAVRWVCPIATISP